MVDRKLLALISLVVGLFAFVSSASATFGTATISSTGAGPLSVTSADLNDDQINDLVTGGGSSGDISVLLGNGTGGFAPKVDYTVGGTPRDVAIGDLDGDNDPDLVAANSANTFISVLLNNGSGVFAAPVTYPTGQSRGVAIGDFNGANGPDLAVTNGADQVSIFLNDGDGTFGPKTDFTTGNSPYGIVTGYFNRDLILDLAVANESDGDLSILLGGGTGLFGPHVDYPTGAGPKGITTGDFNGDTFADLATGNKGGQSVSVLLGDAGGTFSAKVDSPLGGESWGVATGDLNGDGVLDLAATSGNPTSNIAVLTGGVNGTFGSPAFYGVTNTATAVAIADFDSDPNPDLAVTGQDNSNNLAILLNQAPTATASPTSLDFGEQKVISPVAKTITMTNVSGGDDLLIGSMEFTGDHPGDFFLASTTCGPAVPLGGTCQIDVGFNTFETGSRSASLEISYNGSASPEVVPLTGIGVLPVPDTIIDSGPSGTIARNSATFTFHGTPTAYSAVIQCRIDSGDYSACTSPKTFSGLATGPHTVYFRAQNADGGQDPTPASRSFTVILDPPPVEVARIGKITVKGPARMKMGGKKTFAVRIANSGNAAARGVKLIVKGKGILAKKAVGTIGDDRPKTVKVKLRARKPGKIKVSFKVTSSNAGSKTVRKKITVRT